MKAKIVQGPFIMTVMTGLVMEIQTGNAKVFAGNWGVVVEKTQRKTDVMVKWEETVIMLV